MKFNGNIIVKNKMDYILITNFSHSKNFKKNNYLKE